MFSVDVVYEDALCEVHKTVVGPYENNVYVVRCRPVSYTHLTLPTIYSV